VSLEQAAAADPRVGQEIDVVNVGDDAIEDRRRRLGPGELVDDDVVDEIAERRASRRTTRR